MLMLCLQGGILSGLSLLRGLAMTAASPLASLTLVRVCLLMLPRPRRLRLRMPLVKPVLHLWPLVSRREAMCDWRHYSRKSEQRR